MKFKFFYRFLIFVEFFNVESSIFFSFFDYSAAFVG